MKNNNPTFERSPTKASEAGRKGKNNSPWSKGSHINTKRAVQTYEQLRMKNGHN